MRPGPTNSLASYVPRAVIDRHRAQPEPPHTSSGEQTQCALFFADIAGFSSLAEHLARADPAGAENTHQALNRVLDPLVEIVTLHGGDIVSFAGDCAIGAWFVAPGFPLERCVQLAAHAGIAARDRLACFSVTEELTIDLRIVIAAGDVLRATVGGVFGRWHFTINGPVMAQIGQALGCATPGTVVATPPAAEYLTQARLERDHASGSAVVVGIEIGFDALANIALPTIDAPEVVARYLPSALIRVLSTRPPGWLAELRPVTIAFIGFRSGVACGLQELSAIDFAARNIQSEAERNGGVVTSFMSDEKGTYGIVVWGLPGGSFENNAERAVATAVAVYHAASTAALQCAAGIATGKALCAPLGGAGRYEYAVVGEKTIIAARLMGVAVHGILCDGETAAQIGSSYLLGASICRDLKGRLGQVTTHVVSTSTAPSRTVPVSAPGAAFGREQELELLASKLDELSLGRGGTVVIEGEAGIGKSILVSELMRAANGRRINCLFGQAHDIQRSSAYYVWCDIVTALAIGNPLEPQSERLIKAGELTPGLSDWLPVLEDVAPLGLEANNTTASMSGEARAAAVSSLICQFLKAATNAQPTMLVIEDGHWMDSRSWSITADVASRVEKLLLVVVMRSGHPTPRAELLFIDQAGARHLTLRPLDEAGSLAMIARVLGVDTVTPRLARFVHERSAGHPLYTRELTDALYEHGSIMLVGNGADLKGIIKFDDGASIPDRIKYIVNSRVDCLLESESDKLTLMVCSVVGDSLPVALIEMIHPLQPSRNEVIASLGLLCEREFIIPRPGSTEGIFRFRHDLIRDAVYELVPQRLRRSLHMRIAQWIETAHAGQLERVFNLLAHHWVGAAHAKKSFEFSRLAGLQALERHAAYETVRYMSDAMRMLDTATIKDARPALRVELEHALGLAHYSLGSAQEACRHFDSALAGLGYRVPSAQGQFVRFTLLEGLRQLRYRLVRPRVVDGDRRDRAERAFNISLRLGHLAYFDNDVTRLSFHLFRCLNIAEQLGPSPQLSMMYTSMTAPFAAIPWPRVAARYDRLGKAREIESADITTRAQTCLFRAVYYCGLGRWHDADSAAREAAKLNLRSGDLRRWEESLVVQAFLAEFQGEFAMAAEHFAELVESAERRRDSQTNAWGVVGGANIALCRGQLALAGRLLARARLLELDEISRLALLGYGACIALDHDRISALDQASEALRHILHSRPSTFSIYPPVASTTDTLLSLMAASKSLDGTAIEGIHLKARLACRRLVSVASSFRVAGPQARLRIGQLHALRGYSARAANAWRAGRLEAEGLGMRFEQALLAANEIEHKLASGDTFAPLCRDLGLDEAYVYRIATRGGAIRKDVTPYDVSYAR